MHRLMGGHSKCHLIRKAQAVHDFLHGNVILGPKGVAFFFFFFSGHEFPLHSEIAHEVDSNMMLGSLTL